MTDQGGGPQIISEVLPAATVGDFYAVDLAALTDTQSVYTWEITTDPPLGLLMNATVLTGTPVVAGVFEIGLMVTNPDGSEVIYSFQLSIDPGGEMG